MMGDWEMSMPSSPQLAAIFWALISSPNTVTIRTSMPNRAMLWAMFRPTPPMLTVTVPGLESRPTRGPAERPPMSTFTAPATAT